MQIMKQKVSTAVGMLIIFIALAIGLSAVNMSMRAFNELNAASALRT